MAEARDSEDEQPSARAHGALATVAHVAAEAADARAMLAGRETVQELDPDLFSPSAISDRIPTSDDTRYQILKETIRENGQLIPIIARPDPIREGKFQVAAGHRRWRAAKELGQPVRAIIRSLSDQEVVVVQGQENGARADLSFIERARFAGQLSVYGYSRDTVATALNVDKPEEMGGAGSRESDAATRGLLVCNIVCK